MIMYFGTEIKIATGDLSQCLYASKWLDESLNFQRSASIFMEINKKPYEFVVGQVYPLNLTTFTAVSRF